MNVHIKQLVILFFLASRLVWADSDSTAVKLGVVHCCVKEDSFMWSIVNNIKQAAERDGTKIDFVNAEGSQQKQLEVLDRFKQNKPDAILMSIVIDDTLKKPFQKKLIEKLKQLDVPVVFYLLSPENRFMQEYPNAYRVGSIPAQSGILQGEMVSSQWLKHSEWDKNGDGIMQYALLKGPAGNPDAEGRTKWIRATLDTFPTGKMKSKEIAFGVANWDRKKAKELVSEWIADGKAADIEVLVSNNDDMMLGAWDAFKDSPYHPALFGIDALPKTLELIKQGDVTGTVKQDTKAQSLNAYHLAMDLVKKKSLDNLEFPAVGQELIVPYQPITKENIDQVK